MSNRKKRFSQQSWETRQALAALARHADFYKQTAGQQIDLLFSCATMQELHRRIDPDSPLALRYQHWVMSVPVDNRPLAREALLALATRRTELLERPETLTAVGVLARLYGHRQAELTDWKPKSRNTFRQLVSLVRHLYDGYGDVPAWVLEAWVSGELISAGVDLAQLTIHLGQGQSLHSFPGLPVPLTRRLEHEMRQAPAGSSFVEALRYAQLSVRGALPWLRPVMQTAWGREIGPDDSFWLGVVDFFAATPMVDPRQFGPVCDWIHQKRTVGIGTEPPQPGFSLKGRSMESLLAQTERWHRGLAHNRRHGGELLSTSWTGLPVSNFVSGADQRVLITQLLTYEELVLEGRTLRHCVASYLNSCQKGRCGIFTVLIDGVRTLTLEVLPNRSIVQVRGRFNRDMTSTEQLWLTRWADQAQLSLSDYA
ncbi:PcfJ domain-containing protein [Hymenobacter sp. BT175]|uniref:PcfJ domain-containing protein n=1 Tax=Hymenobacter translucens TaxID=2886507 RepID=UPI001D0E6864|nr:PcfJ domain-containing protein [Hymenobacter translucens]MCC2546571.1 PcfJ domain-containing protein [Hymenobacter translucens]